jgi:Methyltransferase domain
MPMENTSAFDPASYGDSCAAFYDQLYPTIEAGLLTTLQALAGNGRVLELGIATGRVAIPLRRAGVTVHGIEASAAMIAAFDKRPEASEIPVIHGDFATAPLGNQYRLIYSLVSTFSLLPTLDMQRTCLQNVRANPTDDGHFVSESFGAANDAEQLESHDYPVITATGIQSYRVTCLHAPLAVTDAMANECGLRLAERWSNWKRAPYSPAQLRHISVYAPR